MLYLFVFAMLAGCAGHWTHDSKSADDFQRDAMRCNTLAWRVVGADGGYVRDRQRENYRDNCLRSLGWRSK